MSDYLYYFEKTCPTCGKETRFATDKVPDRTWIVCSHCGSLFGTWREVVDQSDRTKRSVHETAAGNA
jgi:hypothetical protein